MDGAFGAKRRRRGPIINITPLIDVMFLLLIFFMVSSTFREHLGMDVHLPKAGAASAQEEEGYEVTVTRDGVILWEGRPVSVDGLRELLGDLLAREPEAAVVLRADEATAFQDVVTVMDVAREMGGSQLIIPTEPLAAGRAARTDTD